MLSDWSCRRHEPNCPAHAASQRQMPVTGFRYTTACYTSAGYLAAYLFPFIPRYTEISRATKVLQNNVRNGCNEWQPLYVYFTASMSQFWSKQRRTFQPSRSPVGTRDDVGVNNFTFSATCYTRPHQQHIGRIISSCQRKNRHSASGIFTLDTMSAVSPTGLFCHSGSYETVTKLGNKLKGCVQ